MARPSCAGRAYNGLLIVVAAAFLWLGSVLTLEDLGLRAPAVLLGVGVLLLGPFLVVIASFALVINGVLVISREGARASTVLPLVFGLASLGVLVALFVILGVAGPAIPAWVAAVMWFVFLAYVYLGVQLVAYSAYAWLYARLPDPDEVDAVVVLGAGLSKGYWVTPLLAGRLRRGLQIRDEHMFEGRPAPLLVTSGGQGSDERRPEGVAMAEWLTEQAVPAEQILVEDRSRTTEQNLRLSAGLLEQHRPEKVVVATSNYHVLRTAGLVRKIGLDWRVVGTRTAPYYAPTAFLREFIAHLSYAWRWHVAAAVFVVAFSALALWVLAGAPLW